MGVRGGVGDGGGAGAEPAAPAMRRPATFVAAALALLLSAPALAQETRFRGPDGRDAGRVERGSAGTLRFYDAQGRDAGRAEQGSDGTTRFYDRDGRPAGQTEGPAPDAGRPPAPTPRGTGTKARE